MVQTPLTLVVLMPVYNDWASAADLIRQLDATLSRDDCRVKVLLVDDGSQQQYEAARFGGPFSTVRTVQVLRLRRNLGHQRAIAIGLAHIQQTVKCDAVVVMDSDGQDAPDGVVQLVRAYTQAGGAQVVFAERVRRAESLLFQASYKVYRVLHHLLTGIEVRVGNFSIVPASCLETIVVLPELWNHYAAAVFRARLPFTMAPIPRARRTAGESKMNYVALASHGLSAISVFGDIVGVRLLVGTVVLTALAVVGFVAAGLGRLYAGAGIPGWALATAAGVAVILIQIIIAAASFTFLMLSNRANLGFVPVRDYAWFVSETVGVYSSE